MLPRARGAAVLLAGALFAGSHLLAQTSQRIYTVTPEIPGVVRAGTPVELLHDRFDATEGPINHPDGSLLFTETDRITRIDSTGRISTYIEPSGRAHGLAWDSKGRLIAVGQGFAGGRPFVGVLEPERATLVDNFEGQAFLFMNDLIVDRKGGIYFTDAGYINMQEGLDGPRKGHGVYYRRPDGTVVRLPTDDVIDFPSSIILNIGETVLYANSLNSDAIYAYDVRPDGGIVNRRVFGRLKGQSGISQRADGMTIDKDGRLYVTTTFGIQVLGASGEHLGTISLSPRPQNVAFAGPDKRWLYAVAFGSAYKIETLTQGFLGRAK